MHITYSRKVVLVVYYLYSKGKPPPIRNQRQQAMVNEMLVPSKQNRASCCERMAAPKQEKPRSRGEHHGLSVPVACSFQQLPPKQKQTPTRSSKSMDSRHEHAAKWKRSETPRSSASRLRGKKHGDKNAVHREQREEHEWHTRTTSTEMSFVES